MKTKRKIEIFSAGCTLCTDTIDMIELNSCSSCDVKVLDMRKSEVINRAKKLGIKRVPTVLIDGKLAECCKGDGPDISTLKSMGLGKY